MTDLLTAAFDAIGKALDMAKYAQAHEWRNKCAKLQLQLVHEQKRGYDRDDAKIETLLKELKIALDCAAREFDPK